MPNTNPINDIPALTRWMQAPERGASVNVFPIAAATVGSAGERLTDFAALQRAGAVAVTDDGKPVLDQALMDAALRQAAQVGIPIIQHAEDTKMTAGAAMNESATAFRLGLRGMKPDAETNIVTRDILLARDTGGHLHVAHLSTAGALDAVREGKRLGVRVTCEVTPHHLALVDEDVGEYRTNFCAPPPIAMRCWPAAPMARSMPSPPTTRPTRCTRSARNSTRPPSASLAWKPLWRWRSRSCTGAAGCRCAASSSCSPPIPHRS
jgi:dihydroorotase